jgi:hypothetical protein
VIFVDTVQVADRIETASGTAAIRTAEYIVIDISIVMRTRIARPFRILHRIEIMIRLVEDIFASLVV